MFDSKVENILKRTYCSFSVAKSEYCFNPDMTSQLMTMHIFLDVLNEMFSHVVYDFVSRKCINVVETPCKQLFWVVKKAKT